jgi:hypothetical protein
MKTLPLKRGFTAPCSDYRAMAITENFELVKNELNDIFLNGNPAITTRIGCGSDDFESFGATGR